MCELLKSLSKMVKLGEGDTGSIYDVGNNRMMKVTREIVDGQILELVAKVGLSQRSVLQHSKSLDMDTDERIPILFTEDQKNKIKNIQQRDSVKQAEIDNKLRLQKAREDAMRQVEVRKAEALKRISRT